MKYIELYEGENAPSHKIWKMSFDSTEGIVISSHRNTLIYSDMVEVRRTQVIWIVMVAMGTTQ
jgi:hypothetical protein